MTIRFAAATSGANAISWLPASKPLARTLVARAMERVDNDNGPKTGSAIAPAANPAAKDRALDNEVLQAALRHFAQHGMGAATVARARAQSARLGGDRRSYDWWLAITRTLDRRLAAELERQKPGFA